MQKRLAAYRMQESFDSMNCTFEYINEDMFKSHHLTEAFSNKETKHLSMPHIRFVNCSL
jgi:hypothetical protein